MRNFSYLIPGVLAGTDQPRSSSDLQRLKKAGIKVLVTVMEDALARTEVEALGIEYHFWFVQPYGTPSLEQLNAFVNLVNEKRVIKQPVAVHCYMGWGRTGTFLAAYLISEGMSVKEAIHKVRQKRPNSIETYQQEQILHTFAQKLRAQQKTI